MFLCLENGALKQKFLRSEIWFIDLIFDRKSYVEIGYPLSRSELRHLVVLSQRVSLFLREPCCQYESMLSGTHVEMKMNSYLRGAMIFDDDRELEYRLLETSSTPAAMSF